MPNVVGAEAKVADGIVSPLNLQLDVDAIKGELVPYAGGGVPVSDVSPEMEAKAAALLSSLLSVNPSDIDGRENWKTTIEQAGADIAKTSSQRASMLKKPLKDFQAKAEDGGHISNALVGLAMQVQELDPNRIDFSVGGVARLLSKLPFVGTPVQRYFLKYETADNVIAGIMQSLNAGAEMLNRDNVTLSQDQKILRVDTLKLQEVIALLMHLDRKLSQKIEDEISRDDPRRRFLEEEILFPLRQVIGDRQELLLACQQGVIAYEILMRNNKELIRGVRRANQVTLRALEIAVTIAVGLYDQDLVLKSLTAVDKATSDLLAGTAARLKQQGVEIQKRAASANLDPTLLKQAFADLNQALVDLSTYRQDALPKMATQILEFDQMAQKGEESIRRLEAGNRTRANMQITDEGLVVGSSA